MRYSFGDVLAKIEYGVEHKNDGYAFDLLPKYNKIVGNLTSGIYTAIAGLPGAGITSFIDQNYVLGPLIQWYNNTDPNRNELIIAYFSLRDDEMKKLQQFTCLYTKMVNGIHIDIPTLNSTPGRLYDIEKEELAIEALQSAQEFFDNILENNLILYNNQASPTDIRNKVEDLVENNPDANVMVIVDPSIALKEDTENFGTVRGAELHKKMDETLFNLTKDFGVTATIAVPVKSASGFKMVKDNEPHYNQLGQYTSCHRGVIIYDPITERNPEFVQDEDKFISKAGLNTLRTWTVVRNTEGKNAISNPFLLLPGTSYIIELGDIDDILDFSDVKNYLLTANKSPYYNSI
jgi:hypothetical protein